ncbi:MAG: hypothetical protein WBO44_02755 [Saprospiraceae bacterium]
MNPELFNFDPPNMSFNNDLYADTFVDRIEQQVTNFVNDLESDEAYAVYVYLKDGTRINAAWFGYHNPHLVIIEGTNQKNQSVKLLSSMSDIQILLVKDKKNVLENRKPLGFQRHDSEDTSSSEKK